MLKSLKIDPYIDGYNWGQINCLEIPIAGAAGSYNYDNYYFYSFYYSIMLNWMDIRSKSISDIRNYSLKKLGLTMKSNRVKDSTELESLIKDSIDKSIPLILIADYTSLFYTNDYLCNNTAEHGVIISGYHTEKSVIVFRETKVVDTNIEIEASKHFKGNPLFTMLVRKDLVVDIWNNRNRYYEQKDKEQVNIIYTIEKDSNAEVNSYEEIICDLACYNNFEHDNLIELINNFNNLREKIKDETIPMWVFWRNLLGSLEAFFYCIETYFKSIGFENLVNFNKFKEEYLAVRANILSMLHAYALRGKDLSIEKKEAIITEMELKNRNLAKYIINGHEIIKQDKQNKNKGEDILSQFINYALGAQASADSEYINGAIHCKASQAVNGKWNDWINDMWNSDALENEHWLKIDLLRPQTIVKFVVRHYHNEAYKTVDFQILGSNDDENWDMLVNVQENKDDVTIHEVMPCTYRYYKLFITKPAMYDYYARIYEFEIWGEKKNNEY